VSQRRVFTKEYKVGVAQRIVAGESVSALHRETGVKRAVLYRWRDAYQKEGAAAFGRPVGRPPRRPGVRAAKPKGERAVANRIAELERKIGQQALEIDFLTRAFKRVKEERRHNAGSGAPASTEKSEK
jgi:transposase